MQVLFNSTNSPVSVSNLALSGELKLVECATVIIASESLNKPSYTPGLTSSMSDTGFSPGFRTEAGDDFKKISGSRIGKNVASPVLTSVGHRANIGTLLYIQNFKRCRKVAPLMKELIACSIHPNFINAARAGPKS